ncbi:nicotinamide riboside transporter PnuC [Sphingobacterium corticibacter]|uniref:Nicotinamide riboside transporter PnuC n=1 Tax=Sphingobacterium corticibacter TaxID=2171749 RepID=A0A2T8HI26_9SPHI|nr:nicotinamide riboside transporter PnuC [Sphingobacterium corticibacter]PVH25081.1 nicotinamide riboside transporter PnuC [Sphingobacterium corticibacter]
MDIVTFTTSLAQAFEQTSWIERLSVLFGICQVLLSKNNKIANYPVGIIGIVLGMAALYGAKLYAEILLNVYYLVMSAYGWWYWTSNRIQTEQPITSANRRDWGIVIAIVLGGFALLYVALRSFTDSDVPLWDAWVSCTAWAGMWLLARRKLENWLLLNLSNLFAIPLLVHKELYLFAILTTFLFIVAFIGFAKWRRIMKTQTTHA